MSTKTSSFTSAERDEQYDDFERLVRDRVAGLSGPLFTTACNADELWINYLDGIPADRRGHYQCHACRKFIQQYGGLVTINAFGEQSPALWVFEPPAFFYASVVGLNGTVNEARVDGVFLSSDRVWGTPKTGDWTHLAGTPASAYRVTTRTASQAMAEKAEDFKVLSRGLADYPADVVAQALRVLEADALDRSEKTVGVARFMADLHAAIRNSPSAKHNLVWAAVARAPAGFCHVRSTMISTLLDDVVAGLDFESIRRRWADKMHPLKYQRPQAPPSAGTIEQAEKLVEKLGVARSLERRFATLDDVLAKLWTPPTDLKQDKPGGGVFGHLRNPSKVAQAVAIDGGTVTFEKFARTVLPAATAIEVQVPAGHGPFYGLATATHADAPAILQWDGLEGRERNPVSWYFYAYGSTAENWGLAAGAWAKVTAVFRGPHRWQEPQKFDHQGDNVYFAVDGCRDRRNGGGLALFPETLKAEFHGIRAVIEAHGKTAKLSGAEAGNANGLALSRTHSGNGLTVRVTTAGGPATYRIDRLD